jgi:hypothetical protein
VGSLAMKRHSLVSAPERQLAEPNEGGVKFNCETTCLSDVSPRNVAEGQGLTHFGRQRKDSVAMCLVARLQSQPFSRD